MSSATAVAQSSRNFIPGRMPAALLILLSAMVLAGWSQASSARSLPDFTELVEDNAGAVVNRVRKASVEAVTLGEKRPMDDSVQATDSCDPSSSVLTHPNALCKSAPLLASWEGSCMRGIFV